jgi:hypothetical protein
VSDAVSPNTAQAPDQWLRKWTLLYQVGEKAIDLSELHLKFETRQSDFQMPNTAFVRIYNLSAATLQLIYGLSAPSVAGTGPEFAKLILQAGYQNGNFAEIFNGTVKQLTSGKETATDTFLDILAADLDLPYNFGVISQTLAPGTTPQQAATAIASGMGVQTGDLTAMGSGGVIPRGKVLYGMGKDYLQALGATTGTKLVIQNGMLVAIPVTGYLPGEAVQLNSQTGMIGVPTATQNGVEIVTLLNPKITIGTRVQINNKDINQTTVVARGQVGPLNDISYFASVSADGFYRVMIHEIEGDTRGQPWYSRLTCLAIDPSSQAGASVLKYG